MFIEQARQIACRAAAEAGERIREKVHHIKRISLKTSESDLVTEVDKQAEEIIRSTLLHAFPDHDILGEEGVPPGKEASIRALEEKLDKDYLWIVDPIDGTTNFIHGFPFFCVSIALAVKGELQLGVIYDPMRDDWFVAEKGNGATLNGETVRVSQEERLSESLIASGFPPAKNGPSMDRKAFFVLLPKVRNIRVAGSAALELAYVAAGRLSGFWEINLNAWDIAAGALLVSEAGGEISDTLGNPYDLRARNVVATNGRIQQQVIDTLKETQSTGFENEQ